MSASPLDESAWSASKELRGRGAPDPDVLLLMATGVGLLPGAFQARFELPLEGISGVPRAWRGLTLRAGDLEGATFWLLDDAPSDDGAGDAAAWERAFPVWLAATSGASLCVHTSAGTALGPDAAAARGRIAVLRDHLNLSGGSPLLGLGESRLGPLFPDQSRTHHAGLRSIALRTAERLGLGALEGVAACTAGPAIETPAERDWYHRAGADLAVQELAAPLIAAAHAGLSCLALVALISGDRERGADVAGLIESAQALAPGLEDLLRELAPDLARVAFEEREEL